MSADADIGSMLGNLISDPEMLSKAMSMASALKGSGLLSGLSQSGDGEKSEKPSGGGKVDGDTKSDDHDTGESTSAQAHMSSHSQRLGDDKNRIALIKALMPYLSKPKREKAEMLIGILKLLSNFSEIRG